VRIHEEELVEAETKKEGRKSTRREYTRNVEGAESGPSLAGDASSCRLQS
jgi:hypothetical protein